LCLAECHSKNDQTKVGAVWRQPEGSSFMGTLHQFTYGAVTPILAYVLSFVGSLLGLVATSRARAATTRRQQARWLMLAAWSIGGTAVWVMHFVAMIGVSVPGTPILYDVPMTIASWLISVLVVGAGLFLVGYGRPSVAKLLVGGPITGLGVAAMHYTGTASLHIDGTFSYARSRVVASIVIAIVAATVALWFTMIANRPASIILASAIMGVAVVGMHYTGMSGMQPHVGNATANLRGVDPLLFLVPILIFVMSVAGALAYSLLAMPSKRDREFQARLPGHPDYAEMAPIIPSTSAFVPRRERTRRH
jgi:NO-binding membrane sensor protein with MHYT domain